MSSTPTPLGNESDIKNTTADVSADFYEEVIRLEVEISILRH